MSIASSPSLRLVTLALIASLAGCAKSSTVSPTDASMDGSAGNDGGNDGGTDGGDGAVALCPNGVIDPGESCDDGNMVNGDGCNNDCTFSAICGNGHLDAGEQCDDGNNRSGDGCDGLCRTEACGNMRLDAGEVCDGTPGCAADCKSVTTCGNGTLDAGEQCDDGNATSWDGCSAACETEKSVVISDLVLSNAPPAPGCDVNLDGIGDNALAGILGSAWTFVGPLVMNQLQMPPFIVLTLLGAEDPTLVASDPSVRVAWLGATDADSNPNNNFDGTGTVHVVASTVNGTQPRLSFAGSVANAIVNAGPEDVTLPLLAGQYVGLERAHLASTSYTVTTVGSETRYSVDTNAGHLCGTLSVNTVAALPNVLALAAGSLPVSLPTNSCSPSVADSAIDMADVFLGGASATVGSFSLPVISAVMPDVDFDGDGLETFVLATGDSCQSVVTACIDGDGTRIDGHDCTKDPRIADGWSSAFDFTAAPTRFVP